MKKRFILITILFCYYSGGLNDNGYDHDVHDGGGYGVFIVVIVGGGDMMLVIELMMR